MAKTVRRPMLRCEAAYATKHEPCTRPAKPWRSRIDNCLIAFSHRDPVTAHLERISTAVSVKGKDLAHEKMGGVGSTRSFRMARLENRVACPDLRRCLEHQKSCIGCRIRLRFRTGVDTEAWREPLCDSCRTRVGCAWLQAV